MVQDQLLTELERQKKYLAELPEDFVFPLFNSAKALESQRRSGYRTTASAAREIVDNAVEAGAKKVHVIFDRPKNARKAHQHKDSVSAVAFIDDGSGMLPKMARYALSWGGGTHFDNPNFIGKFGFGLPNASINQTQRVEVYTRTASSEPFTKAYLDITEHKGFAVQTIKEPTTAALPDFVQEYLDREGWDFQHGTVVVWVHPDRLSYRVGATLKEHLLDDFGVTYRYLLRKFELKVEGVLVQSVDPLFLDPEARYYLPPIDGAVDQGGAQLQYTSTLPVKFTKDPDTGNKHLEKLVDGEDLKDENLLATGVMHVRVVRFPLGFAASRKGDAKIEPLDEHSPARLEIRKPRRGMSFVRADREIHTLDIFPQRIKDEARGLGIWPLLQGYAYHWAVEVRFDPTLDEAFGIGNDKQTVRPIEDFWRVLASEGIDKVLNRENRWQRDQRRIKKDMLTAMSIELPPDQPRPAELAAQTADAALGSRPKVPENKRPQVRQELERKAEEKAAATNQPTAEVLEAMEEQSKRRPYRIEYVDADHGLVYVPRWEGTTVVVEVNRKHPFYRVLYGQLGEIQGGGRAKEAVDLLLIALSKGELSDNEQTEEFYRTQRETLWSPFLATGSRDLQKRLELVEMEEEVVRNDGEDDEEAAA